VTDSDTAHEIPEFELPDWGTEGAPPAPPSEPGDSPVRPPAREIALEVEPEIVLSTAGLVSGWATAHVLDIATGVGFADKDDPVRSTAKATSRAFDALRQAARAMEADAVVEVRLSIIAKKAGVTVTAYGTAVLAPRP
jgi:uncharacterized protein YbjQ (UPF0145 family)